MIRRIATFVGFRVGRVFGIGGIVLGVVATCALARSAAAADAVPQPCPQPVETAVRATLPAASRVVCMLHRSDTHVSEGHVIAGTIDSVRAEAVLTDGRTAVLELTPEGQVLSMTLAHGDIVASSDWGMAVLFWAFALASVVGSLFVVTRRNLIAAVMGMVGSFLGVAAIYMLLYAQFIAVIQVLVYAGAIMVLFVFVVMILNRPEDEPIAPSGRAGQALGALAIIYLVVRLILTLVRVEPPNPEVARAAPPPLPEQCTVWKDNACVQTERPAWGSISAVGGDLFNAGLFPFEAISVLLLVAVVGAIAIARPLHEAEDDPGKKRAQGGVA
jgi:NADH-quinone oxidoreductase subunit J